MSLLQATTLSPRDIASLSGLKDHGLALVEVKISRFSPARGKRIESISLPEKTHPVCVIREREPILNLFAVFLQEGDIVYLLTDDETTVRELFTL